MTASWERELTRMERDLNAASSLLDAGEAPPAERWFPPEDLGPLPAQLRSRVEQLLERLDVISRRATECRDELGRELSELHQRRSAARAYQTSSGPVGDEEAATTMT